MKSITKLVSSNVVAVGLLTAAAFGLWQAVPTPPAAASPVVDGQGIPTAERDRVLERFYRLDSSRSTPGAGLGLSLVAAVEELYQCRLELQDNQPGLRAEFLFPADDYNRPG